MGGQQESPVIGLDMKMDMDVDVDLERILEKAKARADAAEVFYVRSERAEVGYEGWKLKSASAAQTEGWSLRVVRGGRVGFAATTDPGGIDAMVDNAVATAAFGEKVELEFPSAPSSVRPEIFDQKVADLSMEAMVEYGRTFVARCRSFREVAELGFESQRSVMEARLANSSGFDASYRGTALSWGGFLNRVKENDVFMLYDGSAATHLPDMDAELKRMAAPFAEKMALADNVTDIRTGRLPVVFHPRGCVTLLLPLQAAISGRTVYTGTSPLVGREGEKLFDERFTVLDDGTLDGRVGSSPFDDEGLPKRRIPIVENGVFKNFLFDLGTAARARRRSNGCASRGIFSPPGPSPSNTVIEPGDNATEQIIGTVEEGLLVEGVLGLGQGNILSGTFSNPLGTAFKIEKGNLVGRVKDGTISGNIYKDLKEMIIGDRQELVRGRLLAPHIRVDGLSVTGKQQ